MQSPPSLYIPQFQLRELFVCFGRLNRILAEFGHGDFSVHSIMNKPLLLLTLTEANFTSKGSAVEPAHIREKGCFHRIMILPLCKYFATYTDVLLLFVCRADKHMHQCALSLLRVNRKL